MIHAFPKNLDAFALPSPITNLASQACNPYRCGMVIESIRGFNRAVPFVPYEVRTASGDRFVVPHPDFILISPRGSYIIIIDEQERPHHLNALLIERASPLQGETGKR